MAALSTKVHKAAAATSKTICSDNIYQFSIYEPTASLSKLHILEATKYSSNRIFNQICLVTSTFLQQAEEGRIRYLYHANTWQSWHTQRDSSPFVLVFVDDVGEGKWFSRNEQIYLNFIHMHLPIHNANTHTHIHFGSYAMLTMIVCVCVYSRLWSLSCNLSWHNRHAFLSSIYKINSSKMCVKSTQMMLCHSCILNRREGEDVCEVWHCSTTTTSRIRESERNIENGKQMLVCMIFNYR